MATKVDVFPSMPVVRLFNAFWQWCREGWWGSIVPYGDVKELHQLIVSCVVWKLSNCFFPGGAANLLDKLLSQSLKLL